MIYDICSNIKEKEYKINENFNTTNTNIKKDT